MTIISGTQLKRIGKILVPIPFVVIWEKVVATRNFNYSEIKELLPEIKFLLENNNTN